MESQAARTPDEEAARKRKRRLRNEVGTAVNIMIGIGLLVPGAVVALGANAIVIQLYGGRGAIMMRGLTRDGSILQTIDYLTLGVQAVGGLFAVLGLVVLVYTVARR